MRRRTSTWFAAAGGSSGGGGATAYTTYSSLETALLAGSVGDTADLVNGSGQKIATWRKAGASALRVEGVVRLDLCSGAEFTIGATGGAGFDIEYDGGSAPSLSSGLTVSGQSVYFRCFGLLGGQGSITTEALFTPSTLTNTAGQRILIGTAANSDTAGSLFGVEYSSGWVRCDRSVTGGFGGISSATGVSVGTESHIFNAQLATTSTRAFGLGGGFTAGDSGTSQSTVNSERPETDFDDHCVMVRVEAAGGNATVNFSQIGVLAMAPS